MSCSTVDRQNVHHNEIVRRGRLYARTHLGSFVWIRVNSFHDPRQFYFSWPFPPTAEGTQPVRIVNIKINMYNPSIGMLETMYLNDSPKFGCWNISTSMEVHDLFELKSVCKETVKTCTISIYSLKSELHDDSLMLWLLEPPCLDVLNSTWKQLSLFLI